MTSLRVQVGPELASLDALEKGVADDLAARQDHSLAEELEQPRVVRLLHEQRAGERHADVPSHMLDVGDEVAAGVARVAALGRVAQAVDGGADEVGLVAIASLALGGPGEDRLLPR